MFCCVGGSRSIFLADANMGDLFDTILTTISCGNLTINSLGSSAFFGLF